MLSIFKKGGGNNSELVCKNISITGDKGTATASYTVDKKGEYVMYSSQAGTQGGLSYKVNGTAVNATELNKVQDRFVHIYQAVMNVGDVLSLTVPGPSVGSWNYQVAIIFMIDRGGYLNTPIINYWNWIGGGCNHA